MFVFYSNRAGCLRSLAFSIFGTALLVLVFRSCG